MLFKTTVRLNADKNTDAKRTVERRLCSRSRVLFGWSKNLCLLFPLVSRVSTLLLLLVSLAVACRKLQTPSVSQQSALSPVDANTKVRIVPKSNSNGFARRNTVEPRGS